MSKKTMAPPEVRAAAVDDHSCHESKAPAASGAGPKVHFIRSRKDAFWDDSYDNLLEFAEAAGLTPDFSCRSGICETCICGLIKGSVEYVNEPLECPDDDKVLICSAKPISDIWLDL